VNKLLCRILGHKWFDSGHRIGGEVVWWCKRHPGGFIGDAKDEILPRSETGTNPFD